MKREKRVVFGVIATTLLLVGGVWAGISYLPNEQAKVTKESPAQTEEELTRLFADKKPVDDVAMQTGESLLAKIKSEQPAFNAEGHGYFVVKGDSMTPNFYEGDLVQVTDAYQDGDFVALTIEATGEHLVKQLVGEELVSSNASGGYYQLEDVTVHGKVERVKDVAVKVRQTLQAATGVYVVDVATSKNNVFVLLSNGQVYARYVYDGVFQDPSTFTRTWRETDVDPGASWYLSGTSFSIPSDIQPIRISTSDSNVFVLLSNGQVYARYVYDGVFQDPSTFTRTWRDTDVDPGASWYLSGTSIPATLVNAPSSGGTLTVPEKRLVGRVSAGAGDAEYLTQAQAKEMLGTSDIQYYPIGTTAASVGKTEVRSVDAQTKVWRTNIGGEVIYHLVILYAPPTSVGDLKIR